MFFSFGAPQHWKIAIFCFQPVFSANGRPKAKMAQNHRISRFPTSWGLVSQKVNFKKVADNHPGQRGNFFFPLRDPECREIVFLCFWPGPKMGQKPTKSPFPTGGGPTKKKLFPRQLRKTIRDSVVTFFSISGPLLLCGLERALLAACLLLAARRASSTLEP